MIINAGIIQIYYEEGYDDPLSDQMLTEAGLILERLYPWSVLTAALLTTKSLIRD